MPKYRVTVVTTTEIASTYEIEVGRREDLFVFDYDNHGYLVDEEMEDVHDPVVLRWEELDA